MQLDLFVGRVEDDGNVPGDEYFDRPGSSAVNDVTQVDPDTLPEPNTKKCGNVSGAGEP